MHIQKIIPTFVSTVPALHTIRTASGSFFYIAMANKPAYTVANQIALLKQRGMLFRYEANAPHFLENISYYRLTQVQTKKPFLIISGMVYLCNQVTPNHQIKNKIIELFNSNPTIRIYKLGFLNNWKNELLWKY